jgi:hypothetical protein
VRVVEPNDPMYLRHGTIEKEGKRHTYWRLVRSVRAGRKVRQQTVATLGELNEQGRLEARASWKSLRPKLSCSASIPLGFDPARCRSPHRYR